MEIASVVWKEAVAEEVALSGKHQLWDIDHYIDLPLVALDPAVA